MAIIPHTHDLGALVKVTGIFTDEEGDSLDPTAVKMSWRTPAGVNTTKVYVTDAEVVKEEPGEYYVLLDANESGLWYYRWWSTGTGQAAKEFQYSINIAKTV